MVNLHCFSNYLNLSKVKLNKFILVKFDTTIYNIVKIMLTENYIKNFSKLNLDGKYYLLIELLYINKIPVFNHVKYFTNKSISNYKTYKSLKSIPGTFIISTNKGIYSITEALNLKLGGLLLLHIF